MSEKELMLLMIEKLLMLNENLIRDTDQGCKFYDNLLEDIWEILFKLKQKDEVG